MTNNQFLELKNNSEKWKLKYKHTDQVKAKNHRLLLNPWNIPKASNKPETVEMDETFVTKKVHSSS